MTSMLATMTHYAAADEGYRQLLGHLLKARATADQLDDPAAVAMIDVLQRLCAARGSPELLGGATDSPPAALSFSVYMLGSFRMYLSGRAISGWRKKGESLLKFLVCHRGTPVHRDQITELFWPEAEPQAARNCLNVTLHGLRKLLKSAGGRPAGAIIHFADDRYQLDDELQIWCDTDAFEQHVARARAAEQAGKAGEAIAHYELGRALYQGDFLSESRYDEWTAGRRERLRTLHLALLVSLGQLYHAAGEHTSTLECAQTIIEYDSCHEEAYRLSMRAYAAQGQRGLALRQYSLCLQALDHELGVAPMPATEELAQRIRCGEPI